MSAEAAPANDAFTITKSDATVFNANAIYVGTTGDVAVVTFQGTTVTFPSVPAGYILPIRCIKVLSTGTTASGLVGMKY